MTRRRAALVAALGLAACAGLAGEPVAPPAAPDNRYATLVDARAARLFDEGWLPDVLPAGSGPIAESHDPESGARCARAVFPASRQSDVVVALLEYGFDRFRGTLSPPERCPFRIPIAGSHGPAFRNAEGKNGGVLYALVAEGEFYFWSARR